MAFIGPLGALFFGLVMLAMVIVIVVLSPASVLEITLSMAVLSIVLRRTSALGCMLSRFRPVLQSHVITFDLN